MIEVVGVKGKDIALFGLGGSGIATAQALVAGGANVTAWDDNPKSVDTASGQGLRVADLRNEDWSRFTSFVLSPGVPLTHPNPHWSVDLAKSVGVEIIGDVELFARTRKASGAHTKFIAITGTNGKSTTTALVAHMLRSAGRDTQMGGNIGKAVLTLDPPIDGRHYVVECSSYQIDLAPTLDPDIGIFLNLTADHLDRHGTIENYAAIKERLVAKSRIAIVSVDDSWCREAADRLHAGGLEIIRISVKEAVDNGYYLDGSKIVRIFGGKAAAVADLEGIGSLRGKHNAQNALAASAACSACGLNDAEIQSGLSSFPGLAHRMEQIGRIGNVLFVNDSKATNADAVATALASYERIYWIAGGLAKDGGISILTKFFPKIAKAYLIGESAPAFSVTLGHSVPYEISGTIDAAVINAARDAASDNMAESVVLLSPACASFDQFRNFEVRGDIFREAVLALPGIVAIGEKR